jgi:hypothetical protein
LIWKRGEAPAQSSFVTLNSADSCVTCASVRPAGSGSVTPLKSSAVSVFDVFETSVATPSVMVAAPNVVVPSAASAGALKTSESAARAASRSFLIGLCPPVVVDDGRTVSASRVLEGKLT